MHTCTPQLAAPLTAKTLPSHTQTTNRPDVQTAMSDMKQCVISAVGLSTITVRHCALPWRGNTDCPHLFIRTALLLSSKIYVSHVLQSWNEGSPLLRQTSVQQSADTPPARHLRLTLSLLMSYIYGAPSKARNLNVVYIWTYVWQRWKPHLSTCCTMFQNWINSESYPVSQLCVNTLLATKVTLITDWI
jgi:hypothetical protein